MLDKKNKKLTHIDSSGKANMVEISNKEIVSRTAKARGKIYLSKETIKLIKVMEKFVRIRTSVSQRLMPSLMRCALTSSAGFEATQVNKSWTLLPLI